jgi:hypothetical protein
MQTNYARPINSKITASARDIIFLVRETYGALKNPATRYWAKDYVKDIVTNCKYIVNNITAETKRDTEQTAAFHKHL